jgi:hypothetical protein
VPDAEVEGVLVSPMAPSGVELMVGGVLDPVFGPVVTLGAGGVAVEILGDVAFRAVPVTPLECHEMIDELTVAPMLDGFRGGAVVDRERIVDLLLSVSGCWSTSRGSSSWTSIRSSPTARDSRWSTSAWSSTTSSRPHTTDHDTTTRRACRERNAASRHAVIGTATRRTPRRARSTRRGT